MEQAKLDLIKEYETCCTAKTTPELVEKGKFLRVDGKGATSDGRF